MEEIKKLVAQYQCNASVDVSSSDSDSDSYISTGRPAHRKSVNEAEGESGKRKTGTARLPTRRPDPNVYNRNALLARENRRKKKAYMEAVEKELDETRCTNRSLLKALKKQFKLTQKLEKECQYLKDVLGNCKNNKNVTTVLNVDISSPDNRAASPDGSLISTYSSSSYELPMETNSFPGVLNDDNDYQHQPAPAYEDEGCARFLEENSFGLPECQPPLKPLTIVDEHSYFNKFSEIGFIPSCEWSPSRTPPKQLLQDDKFLVNTDSGCIASL
ncbi:uncharacterized protein LOC115770821 [Drosophila novamexicana]|uniref:uncharacterized protein LOC115770821 n=1 Tax=Drosophila novamexicana TaxID=47314 RepID=UPI0011E5D557|nr:uncharacterized protein LOC115770821 [Drosophila novamexicana]